VLWLLHKDGKVFVIPAARFSTSFSLLDFMKQHTPEAVVDLNITASQENDISAGQIQPAQLIFQ
jgi:hypothetical protein